MVSQTPVNHTTSHPGPNAYCSGFHAGRECPSRLNELRYHPHLLYHPDFYQEQKAKGWQVLGLAVDQPSAVRKWLQAKPLSFAVGMAGLDGTELSKSMGNLAGSLPFTVVFGATGTLLHRKTGKVSKEDLMQWAKLK